MEILVTICARGGSKGIPGKNIKIIGEVPLISLSIKTAFKFKKRYTCDITISTDDAEIKTTALKYGIETPYWRPHNLASDDAGKIDAIQDILLFEEQRLNKRYDLVLDLDVTSPLRNIEDLESAMATILANPDALNIFSVNPANRNPYFNMVEKKATGYYGLIKEGHFLTRQSAPCVYDMNASFYFYRRNFFDLGLKSAITDRSLIYVMPHTCFDLDHEIDFEFMSFLIENQKLGFDF